MRIQEITDVEKSHSVYDDPDWGDFKHQVRSGRASADSRGSFAHGKKTSPFEYEKELTDPAQIKSDPQFLFYKECAKINGSNPYLPVIYHIDIRQLRDQDLILPRYETEQLIGWRDVPVHMLYSSTIRILESMKGSHLSEGLKQKADENMEKLSDRAKEYEHSSISDLLPDESLFIRVSVKTVADRMQDYAMYAIHQIFEGKTESVDDQLQQAGEIVRKIKESNDRFWYDFANIEKNANRANMMYRRTQNGFQAVINDPIAN